MDIYKNNEINANKYVVKCLRIMTVIALVLWFLNEIGVFIVEKHLMNISMPVGLLFFILPSAIEYKKKDTYAPKLKYLYMAFVILGMTVLSAMLTIHTVLVWVIPVLLSCHYYSKKFTLITLIVSLVFMAVSFFVGLYVGIWDSNVMRGTSQAVRVIDQDVIKRSIIFYVMPRSVILCAMTPICFTLSKRTRNLIDEQVQLSAEKNRIDTELHVATKIQSDLLPCIFPAFPDRNEFEIYATMTPAKEVGGDFYDFFLIDRDHLAMVMADVSGKGVPAALFMVIAKTLIKNLALTGLPPKEILEKVNNQLCENNYSEMFVTVWLGILDVASGEITCVNAGHEYPVVCRKEGDFELVKDKHGFVVAGMENARYTEYTLTLHPGDKLFVYTDGVPEATDKDNRLYGSDRLLRVLNAHKQTAESALLQTVKEDIDLFVGTAPQFDDITMMTLSIKDRGVHNA